MITKEIFRQWKKEIPNDEKIYSLFIGFDEVNTNNSSITNKFDIENIIEDKEIKSKKIGKILEDKIGSEFIARLENENFSWNPNFLKYKLDFSNVEKYLSQCDGLEKIEEDYFGNIQINDICSFISVFLDYPQKYNYQDIEIYSISSNFALNISCHGTLWLIGYDKKIMSEIFSMIEQGKIKVLKGNDREF